MILIALILSIRLMIRIRERSDDRPGSTTSLFCKMAPGHLRPQACPSIGKSLTFIRDYSSKEPDRCLVQVEQVFMCTKTLWWTHGERILFSNEYDLREGNQEGFVKVMAKDPEGGEHT